ncbi:MAG TPA: tRNA pseudouridine(38-40) synthase TruA [Dermatophilaceae bacterium]|nr:tRNA pseudouridine(38-40) synthase TruA [Dermatophilaceae bacterium]
MAEHEGTAAGPPDLPSPPAHAETVPASRDQAEGTVRVRLDLGYDGTDFSGWAAQPGRRTVEGVLADALATMLRLPEPVALTVAGRTDAGVHARGQVAHADLPQPVWATLPGRSDRSPAAASVNRLNGILPPDVVVHRVSEAPTGFDARFAATGRRYLYRLCDDPSALDPLRRRETAVSKRPLDADAMDAAARQLLGLGDFAAFCKRREGATTIRTLIEYAWRRDDDGVLAASVVADAFCHSMVRALVGAVVPVGEGRYAVEWPLEVMQAGVRDPRATVMPAHGLSLEEVTYPPDGELAARVEQARATRTLGEGPA